MAATISVKECNGAGPTATTITNCRYCTSDTYTPGTNYPMVKPAAGSNYSYWKHVYLNADDSPAGTINNIKWYCDGTIGWSGVVLKVGAHDSYTQATGTEGTTGDVYSHVTLQDCSATPYTSASPLSVAGTISNPSTGKISDYVISQVTVSTSATAGTLAAETVTFRYDET
jgi:hypothetical protein